ncbi:hypothetical protein D3C85_1735000 [compost metagenome]
MWSAPPGTMSLDVSTMLRSMGSQMPSLDADRMCGPILSNTSHETFLFLTWTLSLVRSALLTMFTPMPVSLVNGSANMARTFFS